MLNRAEQRGVVANGSLFILPGYHPSTASLGCNYSDGYPSVVEGRGVDVQGDQPAAPAFDVLHRGHCRKLEGGLLDDVVRFGTFRKDVHLLAEALGRDGTPDDRKGEFLQAGLPGALEAGLPEAHHDDHELGDGAEGDPVLGVSAGLGKKVVKLVEARCGIEDADNECQAGISCLDMIILFNYCVLNSIDIERNAIFGMLLACILLAGILLAHFFTLTLEVDQTWQEEVYAKMA